MINKFTTLCTYLVVVERWRRLGT